MTDLNHKHHKKNKKGKLVPFQARDNDKKLQIWKGYRKVIGTHFKFLTKEDLQILSERVPNFLSHLDIWSSIDQKLEGYESDDDVEILATKKGSSESEGLDQHFYDHQEIIDLMSHYLDDRENIYFTTPMQGDGAFGSEELKNQIRQYLLENIAGIQQAENVTIFIPFNIGHLAATERGRSGNHWTLGIVTYNRTGLQEIFYADPLGHEIVDTIRFALKNSIDEVFNINIQHVTSMKMQQQLQTDGYNCGPWVVEIARCYAAGQQLLSLHGVEINQRRAEHAAILNPEPANQPHSSSKKKKRTEEEKGERSTSAKKNKNAATTGWNPGLFGGSSSSSSSESSVVQTSSRAEGVPEQLSSSSSISSAPNTRQQKKKTNPDSSRKKGPGI